MATIDGQQVFKVIDNKAQAIAVALGQRTETSVEIVKGLVVGDEIVVAGQFKIKDGSTINVKS